MSGCRTVNASPSKIRRQVPRRASGQGIEENPDEVIDKDPL
jgi:hypothetical protein